MFNRKTLIVVGAGASKEAGLPTGDGLKQRISELLDIRFEDGYNQSNGDVLIKDALKEYLINIDPIHVDISQHIKAALRIREAMPQAKSIDHFIDSHKGNKEVELCGKLAIARAILEAEKQSYMYYDQSNFNRKMDFQALGKTWFNSFMQLLTENCRQDGLNKRLSSITLIIFNYDRCFEYFLFHSLQNFYGMTDSDASELVNMIEIFHPYGTVGSLPWQNSGGNAIDFGREPHPKGLLTLADQIKTFTEVTDSGSSEITTIRQKMCDADIILFLGFAFHRINLDLLRPSINSIHDSREVAYYATAKGISRNDCNIIIDELHNLTGANVKTMEIRNDLACSELFQEYWRSLALG